MPHNLCGIIFNIHFNLQRKPSTYDYIILGAGCAGLSLLMRFLQTPELVHKKILLIDKQPKITNNRTWCFWEKESGFFDSIVYKKWSHLLFASNDVATSLSIEPYAYKMIRGIDLYNYCFEEISKYPNVEVIYEEILQFTSEKITLATEEIACGNAIVFNSTYKNLPQQKNKHYLLQHFKGKIIETAAPFFDETKATLMDFRVHQNYGTAFVYIMPLSPVKALIEYTLFTAALLKPAQYETELNDYINNTLQIEKYTVIEEEFGVIPMTNAVFAVVENGVYNIGTAGGQTKASTGYTFQFIQKQAAAIVALLLENKKPFVATDFFKKRFKFYDSTLLNLLINEHLDGADFFSTLYKNNSAAAIFKFLDNETSLAEELKIMNTAPRWLFTKAAFKEIFS